MDVYSYQFPYANRETPWYPYGPTGPAFLPCDVQYRLDLCEQRITELEAKLKELQK